MLASFFLFPGGGFIDDFLYMSSSEREPPTRDSRSSLGKPMTIESP